MLLLLLLLRLLLLQLLLVLLLLQIVWQRRRLAESEHPFVSQGCAGATAAAKGVALHEVGKVFQIIEILFLCSLLLLLLLLLPFLLPCPRLEALLGQELQQGRTRAAGRGWWAAAAARE
jgi:hypothetical protein